MLKTTGHETLKINVKLLILANGQKLTAFDTLKKNLVMQLYLQVMRKGHNQRTHGQMADSPLGHITRCSSKGKRNAGIIRSQVSLDT
jgi:hypothetical protein